MDKRFLSVLKRIVAWRELELEWLDLLSQLEYVGCRKILKAVPFEKMDVDTLRHVSEEVFHAYRLKKLVCELSQKPRPWAKGRFSNQGFCYFQNLDQSLSKIFPESYPIVSWAIEQRVLRVYPLYADLTRESQIRDTLSMIVVQETRHGNEFDKGISRDLRDAILVVEKGLWEEFVGELEKAVELETTPPSYPPHS